MEKKPEMSIIMPVFNSESYIADAIKSLLGQSFSDFELIVVDDGCTDQSMDIVSGFQDNRIKIIKNDRNSGIVFSRNRGLAAARGRYIAPFDSDDIAHKDKYEKQITFLEKNPDFGMIGSWVTLIDENGKPLSKKWKLDAPPNRIPAILLFRNYFAQPSLLIRLEAIPKGGYNSKFDIGEDYIMWHEISKHYKIWNYPEYLLKCRVHSESITYRSQCEMDAWDSRIFEYIYNGLQMRLSPDSTAFLLDLKNNRPIADLNNLGKFFLSLLDHNLQTGAYDQCELIKVIYNRWIKACFNSGNRTFRSIRSFSGSKLHRQYLNSLFSSY